ncbi:unnamed protein product [Effrenium voratum]|uniref:Uncharacterized protein n=1 Tax=Effrenium voratum TaxID=2562239 RepID=A0AA36JQC3_9DINO|nr:unnamed protein product [Effrenium voratum]CAJ1457847.1 unnamed protein product [Effrenium voratum]
MGPVLPAFRILAALLSVPFAIVSFFIANPEKVKFAQEQASLPLPKRVLTFFSQFAHLTVVSHELTSGYFAYLVLSDFGLLNVDQYWLELYFAVATSVALFVALVFWGCALIDPALMAPVDVIIPSKYQLTAEFKQHLMFGAMFGPTDPDPSCSWQTGFRLFMQYVHTLCPMFLVVDMALAEHSPLEANVEINATLAFAVSYICWNLFCWWLLRVPPYPLQKRLFELGVPWAVFAYAVLSIFAMALCIYVRWVRLVAGWLGALAMVLLVCWASVGLTPWRGKLAEFQGLDYQLLLHGWASGGKSAFLTKEAEELYMSKLKGS